MIFKPFSVHHKAFWEKKKMVGVEPRPASISMRESVTSCISGNKHKLTYSHWIGVEKAARFPHANGHGHWTTIVKIWITPKWLFNVVGPSQSNQQGPFDSAPLYPLVYKIPRRIGNPSRESWSRPEDNKTWSVILFGCRRKMFEPVSFFFCST